VTAVSPERTQPTQSRTDYEECLACQ